MNFREMVMPAALGVATIWGLQYFFAPKEVDVQTSGSRFLAPKVVDAETNKPLNASVVFSEAKSPRKTITTAIETEVARYEFSNDGACLLNLSFLRNYGNTSEYFTTIFSPATEEKENRCFLLGLDEASPYYFDLESSTEESDKYVLTYKTSFAKGTIVKIFNIFKKLYRIDLTINFNLQDGAIAHPRVFFPSPLLPELATDESGDHVKYFVAGIVNDNKGIQTIARNEQMSLSYWLKPTLFGSQDRYFVHAMISSSNKSAQRGYFKLAESDKITAIIEGATIAGQGSLEYSFYMGPKEDSAMNAVDKRLEGTLNYGWFSFISKPFSKLLLHALNFLKPFVHGYGWALILLTIILKILLLPFSYGSEHKAGERQLEFQKKLEYVQHKYKNDPQALADARAELLRKYGLPGLGGCLPVLLQFPVFWALSIIVANAIELYKAPFLWIPDLSAHDPYYILPIACATGIAMSSFMGAVDYKKQMTSIFAALFLGALFTNLSAGLTLYLAVGTWLSILQGAIARRFSA